jgi:hypothetical protein
MSRRHSSSDQLANVVNVLKFRPRATHQDESPNLDSTGHKDRDGFVVVEIRPGKRYKLEAQIAAVPTTLIWEFSTQDLDIAFSAMFYPTNPQAAPLAIRESRRVKCNVVARIGHFCCREPGAIHLVWDNRYSHFRKKQLYFRIYQAHGSLLHATSTPAEFYGSPEYKAMERMHRWWENAVEEQKRRERWDRCLHFCKKLREELKLLSKNERAFCWLHNSRALYKRCQLPDSYYFDLKAKVWMDAGVKRESSERRVCVCLCVGCQSVCRCVCLPAYLLACLPTCVLACLPVCLPACLPASLSVCPSIGL